MEKENHNSKLIKQSSIKKEVLKSPKNVQNFHPMRIKDIM